MAPSKTRKSLLLVDDDAQIRLLLTMILKHAGYEVHSAEDGFSALRSLRIFSPETILSDLNMPGMSGFEFLSVVHRRFPAIRAIAMSAVFPGHQILMGIAADAFYEKGRDIEELLAVLSAPPTGEQLAQKLHTASSLPVWIPPNGIDSSGSPCVIVTCPECLRTFQQVTGGPEETIQKTGCIHCASPVLYAIVHPSDLEYDTPLLTM